MDQILAEETVDGGTDDLVQWTLTDHLNTVRDIAKYDPGTDMTTVVNHLVYDAFGRVTSQSNPAVDSLFLFTARPFDPDTRLQNNLNRWYDPAVGRWLSEDPIGFAGGINLYRYVLNAATNRLDPRGTVSIVASCCSSEQVENLLDNFFAAERAARRAAAELRQVLKELNAKASGPREMGLDWPEAYQSSKQRSGRLLHEISHIYASTDDYAYLGARGSQRYAPQYWKQGVWVQEMDAVLESSELARNADTYEGFFESLYL